MGIRFFCPNGHKLHVKEFQAGLRGICPHCGARMLIPHQSTRPSSRQRRGGQSLAAGEFAATSADDRESALAGDEQSSDEEILAAISGLSGPAPQASPMEQTNDPFAEAGEVVWYVRPPSGGQYGPARTDVMRSWLAEGRISGDTYVWREGWPDWREAERVFPQLSFNRTFPEFDAVVATASDTLATPLPKKSFPSSKIQLAAVGVVALVVFVLFLVFLAIQLSK